MTFVTWVMRISDSYGTGTSLRNLLKRTVRIYFVFLRTYSQLFRKTRPLFKKTAATVQVATTVRVPTQGEETRYKKVPYLSKASFRRINTGYHPKVRKWLPVLVGQKSLPLLYQFLSGASAPVQADLMIALVAVIRDLLCEFLSKSLSEKPR